MQRFGPVVGQKLWRSVIADTHEKIDIFRVCVTLKLETKLLTFPYADLGLICACSHNVQTIMRAPNFIARHGKLEILDELNLGQNLVIFNRCLAFFALVR